MTQKFKMNKKTASLEYDYDLLFSPLIGTFSLIINYIYIIFLNNPGIINLISLTFYVYS